jgi:hypothetical protein
MAHRTFRLGFLIENFLAFGYHIFGARNTGAKQTQRDKTVRNTQAKSGHDGLLRLLQKYANRSDGDDGIFFLRNMAEFIKHNQLAVSNISLKPLCVFRRYQLIFAAPEYQGRYTYRFDQFSMIADGKLADALT